jgi:serine/threonine protein kinase
MLTGYPPFAADTREELFEKIRKGTIKYPSSFTNQIKDLMGHLFEKDPERRWGEGREGAVPIK